MKDDAALEIEQRAIDRQRKKYLDEFYLQFSAADLEQFAYHDQTPIQRHHLSESHLSRCQDVEKYMQDLFGKWDHILSLFPSHSALEQFDRRFDPRTKEGKILYEKLFNFQAWLNLYTEINRLLGILGRLMSCSQCHMWPQTSTNKASELLSRPPTPSSTSSNEQKDYLLGSPPRSSSFINTPDPKSKRPNPMLSMPSMDSLYQQSLGSSASLPDFYYK